MKLLLNIFCNIIFITGLLCGYCISRTTNTCELKYVNDTFNPSNEEYKFIKIVDTTGPLQSLIQLKLVNYNNQDIIIDVKPNSTGKEYISAVVNEKSELNLMIGKDFPEYENNESETVMKIGLNLLCTKNNNRQYFKFSQEIEDTNNHPPEFLNLPYEFALPMPFPKNMNILPFGKNIIARDVDLTNTEMKFELTSKDSVHEYFSIKFDNREGKNYTANFMNLADLNLKNSTELILIATDNGKPPLQTNTTIKISVNTVVSLPTFTSTVYKSDCKKCNMVNEFIKFDKQISLSQEYKKENINFTLNHELKEITEAFKVNITNNTISIFVKELPKTYKEAYVNLQLLATTSIAETSTLLLISLPVTKDVIETSSSSGLLAATIILSILLVGIVIGLVYYYNKHRYNYSDSLMS